MAGVMFHIASCSYLYILKKETSMILVDFNEFCLLCYVSVFCRMNSFLRKLIGVLCKFHAKVSYWRGKNQNEIRQETFGEDFLYGKLLFPAFR
jgi:hypothetical protein